MKKHLKKLLLYSGLLCLAGLLVCLGVLFALDFDFIRLDTAGTNSGTLELSATLPQEALYAITTIDVDSASCDVTVRPAPDGKFRVEYDTPGYIRVTAEVDGNRLVVIGLDSSARQPWYKRIRLQLREHTGITVYVPVYNLRRNYEVLNVRARSGDVTVWGGIIAEHAQIATTSGDVDFRIDTNQSLTITTDSGHVNVALCTGQNLSVTSDSGDVKMSHLTLHGTMDATSDSGDMELSDLTVAGNVKLRSDSGDVAMERLTSAVSFTVNSDSGNVEITDANAAYFTVETNSGEITLDQSGGSITMLLRTDSGDVDMTSSVKYDVYAHSDSGKVQVNNHIRVDNNFSDCKIFTDSGDITVR